MKYAHINVKDFIADSDYNPFTPSAETRERIQVYRSTDGRLLIDLLSVTNARQVIVRLDETDGIALRDYLNEAYPNDDENKAPWREDIVMTSDEVARAKQRASDARKGKHPRRG